jgi:hypothetical protein
MTGEIMSGSFGFGVRAGTTSCPQMKIEIQHYDNQEPVEFIVETCFGTPTIRFNDDTVLVIHKNGDSYEYTLTVSKNAMARLKKQYEE